MKQLSLSLLIFLTACTSSQTKPMTVDHRSIGIFNEYPKATLDITGDIRISQNNDLCTSIIAGTIRWNGVEFEGCDGISWKAFKLSQPNSF